MNFKNIIIKKKSYLFLRLFQSFFAIPLVFFIRLLKPFVFIKLIHIRSDRIGHFITDSTIAIINEKNKPQNYLNIYFFSKQVSNIKWAEIVKRNLYINNFFRNIAYFNNLIPYGKKHYCDASENGSRDIHGKYYKFLDAQLIATDNEDKMFSEWLSKKGIKDKDKYICLLVRDEKYLSLNNNELYNYHSYRDSKIETYYKGISFLLENDIWVIRMGKSMKTSIKLQHPKLIDYSFDETRNDSLDISLFTNCFACITTGSGPDSLANIYHKPSLFINFLPFYELHSFAKSLSVPKTLLWIKNKNALNLDEIEKFTLYKTQDYTKNGIQIVDLNEDEILAAFTEFYLRINSLYVPNDYEIKLQKDFWIFFKKKKIFKTRHNWVNPEANICSFWLKKHSETINK